MLLRNRVVVFLVSPWHEKDKSLNIKFSVLHLHIFILNGHSSDTYSTCKGQMNGPALKAARHFSLMEPEGTSDLEPYLSLSSLAHYQAILLTDCVASWGAHFWDSVRDYLDRRTSFASPQPHLWACQMLGLSNLDVKSIYAKQSSYQWMLSRPSRSLALKLLIRLPRCDLTPPAGLDCSTHFCLFHSPTYRWFRGLWGKRRSCETSR